MVSACSANLFGSGQTRPDDAMQSTFHSLVGIVDFLFGSCLTLTNICGLTEVKVQPQHVEGVTLPLLEPITDDTVHKLTEPDEIKVTTTKAQP